MSVSLVLAILNYHHFGYETKKIFCRQTPSEIEKIFFLILQRMTICRQTPSEIEKIFFLILLRLRICRQTPSEIEKFFFLILLRLRKFFFSFS